MVRSECGSCHRIGFCGCGTLNECNYYQSGYTDGYSNGKQDGEYQGRADAIDECKEKIRIAFVDVMRSYEGVIYPIKWIDDVLEQLKEQKHECG